MWDSASSMLAARWTATAGSDGRPQRQRSWRALGGGLQWSRRVGSGSRWIDSLCCCQPARSQFDGGCRLRVRGVGSGRSPSVGGVELELELWTDTVCTVPPSPHIRSASTQHSSHSPHRIDTSRSPPLRKPESLILSVNYLALSSCIVVVHRRSLAGLPPSLRSPVAMSASALSAAVLRRAAGARHFSASARGVASSAATAPISQSAASLSRSPSTAPSALPSASAAASASAASSGRSLGSLTSVKLHNKAQQTLQAGSESVAFTQRHRIAPRLSLPVARRC